MQLDRTTISLVPRTTANCIDLAVMFVGRQLTLFVSVWLVVALPLTIVVYWLAVQEWIDLRHVLTGLYFATVPLSVLVMNAVVPLAFGESIATMPAATRRRIFTVVAFLTVLGCGFGWLSANLGDGLGMTEKIQTFSIYGSYGTAALAVFVGAVLVAAPQQFSDGKTLAMFVQGILYRCLWGVLAGICLFSDEFLMKVAGLFLCIIPGLLGSIKTGFALEKTCLNRIDSALHGSRVREVIKRESGDLMIRAMHIGVFYCMLWGVLFLTVDGVSTLLFQSPIFIGRLVTEESMMFGLRLTEIAKRAGELLASDPMVFATLTATALLTWPIIRLAWFFCYIDIRVRRDCWDLELRFADECRRLRAEDRPREMRRPKKRRRPPAGVSA